MDTDELIYNRYLQGDEEALDELLLRHKEGLTFFLLGYVHRMEDAEDLMMDTFAVLLEKKVKFKKQSSFKTWLYGIGRNLARNYLRKNRMVSFEDLEESKISGENEPETLFCAEEERKILYDALKSLKEEYRTALYLAYFEKMDAQQIAVVMKKNIKQIYNLMARGKEQLRELFAGEGYQNIDF